MFVGDWARGRILNIKLKPSGASYMAETSVFLEGKPLNVTYLAVGPEGGLYFCTGGRDTEGGVYRVVWKGEVPDAIKNFGEGMESAIRQPQIDSAWSRQRVALVKQQLGASWDKELTEVADEPRHKSESRCRALDLMQLVGPFPTTAQLIRLSRDADDHMRGKSRVPDGHPRRRIHWRPADRIVARHKPAAATHGLRIADPRRAKTDLEPS